MSNKSKAQLEADNRVLRAEIRALKRSYRTETFVSLGLQLIKWTGLVVISYFAYRSVAALAGRRTAADIGIDLLGSIRISEGLAWVLGGGGTAYGLYQRKLKRDTIERLQSRIQQQELAADPRRSTSGLTARGTTRPEDEP